MKFSTILALSVAPLAMAKSVQNTYGKRTPMMMRREHGKEGEKKVEEAKEKAAAPAAVAAPVPAIADAAVIAQLQTLGLSGLGITTGATTNVIVIWVNPGAGAETTTVNAAPAATANPAAAAPAAATTHQVTVGGAQGLIYSPSEVKAAIGDMVVFTFMAANHTVTQSTFDQPCVAMAGGMDSGFQANPDNTVNPPPQVAMQVMVDTPLWFYCKQKGHCGKGMTFSINPSAAKTQAMFQSMAIALNGTGAGTALTGGAAPPAAENGTAATPPPAASAPPAAAAPAAPAASGAGAAAGNAVMGSGSVQGGACVCAVTCSTGSFPAAAAQGLGMFGGMAGSLPMAMSEPAMNGI